MQLKMPYQSEDFVIHGFEFLNEINNDDAFDLSHWDNNEESITYFIPMIDDENELNLFLSHHIPQRLLGPMILSQWLTMSTI